MPRDFEITPALVDVINAERMRLMEAETVLQCACFAFDCCDQAGPRRPYFPNIATVVAALLQQAIDNLDVVQLRSVAEGAGFEPAKDALTRVQAVRVKPLRQPSKKKTLMRKRGGG